MAEKLGEAVLELSTDPRALDAGLKGAASKVKRHVTNVAKIAAVASVAIAGVSIKMAADMEKGLREIGTLMGGLTENEMRAMGHELEVIASRTGQAMDMLTKARYDIVSAGFASAADSAELLRVSADLAVAGVTDIVKAGDLLTTTMNAYGFAADTAEEISDKLFTTVRLGKTTIDEMGGSLGRVLGVAGTLGIDINELLGGFAALTTTMGSSERATTAMLGSINALLTPTKDLERIITALGHESSLAMIKERGFADSISAVVDKAEEMGIEITDAISGMEGLQGILPLTGTAAETFAENIEGVKDSLGATADAAEQMQLDFTFQMGRLKQNVGNIMRAIGRGLITVIQPYVEGANAILQRLGDIGWGEVARAISENWEVISKHIITIMDATFQIASAKIQTTMKIAWTSILRQIGLASERELEAIRNAWENWSKEMTDYNFARIQRGFADLILFIEIEAMKGNEAVESMEGPVDIVTSSWEDLEAAMWSAGEAGRSAGKDINDTMQIASLFGPTIADAFNEATEGGDVFKSFIIKVLNLLEGVIIGASAVNAALTAAWVPVLGIAGLIAAIAVLELAKAGVRGINFAQGGIINAPALITAGDAVARVAEAGRPEGVLPLTRMPGGDLGVRAAGAGGDITLSVTVQSSVIANRQTVRELLEPPLVEMAEKLQSRLRVRP